MWARKGLWALCDQAAVSAGNFLVIAIGAWLLELPEQTKLVYVYTAYIALVLFNASMFFSPTPILRYEVADAAGYRRLLLRIQTGVALAGAGLPVMLFAMLGARFGWAPSGLELAWMFVFLVLQQLADFNRRADYVFGEVRLAAALSGVMLAARVGLLLLLRPDRATTFYLVLAFSAIPGAIGAFIRGRSARCAMSEPDLFRRHLRLARWNMLNAPIQWIGSHLPVLLTGMLAGTGAAAILASVRSVSMAANVLLELMETYVPAWMASHARRDGVEGLQAAAVRLYVLGGGIWLAAALAILIFGESLLGLLLGRTYAAYWPILLLLWVGNGLYFVGRVHGVRHRVSRWTSVDLAGSVGGVFVLIVALPLMVRYGVMGAASVIVLIQLGNVISQVLYTRRFVR